MLVAELFEQKDQLDDFAGRMFYWRDFKYADNGTDVRHETASALALKLKTDLAGFKNTKVGTFLIGVKKTPSVVVSSEDDAESVQAHVSSAIKNFTLPDNVVFDVHEEKNIVDGKIKRTYRVIILINRLGKKDKKKLGHA